MSQVILRVAVSSARVIINFMMRLNWTMAKHTYMILLQEIERGDFFSNLENPATTKMAEIAIHILLFTIISVYMVTNKLGGIVSKHYNLHCLRKLASLIEQKVFVSHPQHNAFNIE